MEMTVLTKTSKCGKQIKIVVSTYCGARVVEAYIDGEQSGTGYLLTLDTPRPDGVSHSVGIVGLYPAEAEVVQEALDALRATPECVEARRSAAEADALDARRVARDIEVEDRAQAWADERLHDCFAG